MKYAFLLVSVLFFISCEQKPGEGGTSTIKGVVMVDEYNSDFSVFRDTYPAQDVEVYLIYGDDEVYGDKFQTGYDGKYEFNYLQDGKYTVYVMSDIKGNTWTSEREAVIKEIEITGKNQEVIVDTIKIID